jgi:hypothetical protein
LSALISPITIGGDLEGAELSGQFAALLTHHRLLIGDAVVDQVGDGADLEAMLGGEGLEVRPPGHGAVFVQDLDDDRRRLETGQPRQIAAGLGMTSPHQHPARLRH